MCRFAIAVVLVSTAVQIASGDVADVSSADTWSATSSGSNGNALVSTSSNLNFNLSQIPVGSTITSATLTILDTTLNWNISGFDNGLPPVPPLTFIGEANGFSDIIGDEYLDSFSDYLVTQTPGLGFPTVLLPLVGFPVGIDPSTIPANGTYSVAVGAQGLMEFVQFDPGNPQQSGTPITPSFTMSGTVDGELEVQFSPGQSVITPEPSSYLVVSAILLVAVSGLVLLKRQRASPLQSDKRV